LYQIAFDKQDYHQAWNIARTVAEQRSVMVRSSQSLEGWKIKVQQAFKMDMQNMLARVKISDLNDHQLSTELNMMMMEIGIQTDQQYLSGPEAALQQQVLEAYISSLFAQADIHGANFTPEVMGLQ
jgi:hypothetical protein